MQAVSDVPSASAAIVFPMRLIKVQPSVQRRRFAVAAFLFALLDRRVSRSDRDDRKATPDPGSVRGGCAGNVFAKKVLLIRHKTMMRAPSDAGAAKIAFIGANAAETAKDRFPSALSSPFWRFRFADEFGLGAVSYRDIK
jgi:hypothetical protein